VDVSTDITVVRVLMIAASMAVDAMLADAAWRNGAADEAVIVDLAAFNPRRPHFAGTIGLFLGSTLCLTATDDVTAVGCCLREASNVGRANRRPGRRCIRIDIEECASYWRAISKVERSIGRPPFLNRICRGYRSNGDQPDSGAGNELLHAMSVCPR
jgi:hypothetical protein